jgi:hypothetical protein
MSFVENLYLRKQLQTLQEENNQLRYLLEANSEETATAANHRIRIEDISKEISQIPGHDRDLVSRAKQASKGRAHPTVLAKMLSKLEQHLSTLRSSSQQQAPRPASGASRTFRSISTVQTPESPEPGPDPDMERVLDRYGDSLAASTSPQLIDRIVRDFEQRRNTGTSSGY